MWTKEEIGQVIKESRLAAGLTQTQVAKALNRPQQTIASWESGKSQPDANTLFVLFKVLGRSVDEAFGFSSSMFEVSFQEKDAIKKYRLLDEYGKEAVDGVLEVEYRRCTEPAEPVQKPETPTVVLHQPYSEVAAAEGAGAFLLDDSYEKITVELNQYTQQADVILKVVGRSMEPAIQDGDRILVRVQPSIRMKEIGVFILDGQGYLKQRAADRLISLNPKVDDVYVKDLQSAECYGKFIEVLNPEWVK